MNDSEDRTLVAINPAKFIKKRMVKDKQEVWVLLVSTHNIQDGKICR